MCIRGTTAAIRILPLHNPADTFFPFEYSHLFAYVFFSVLLLMLTESVWSNLEVCVLIFFFYGNYNNNHV